MFYLLGIRSSHLLNRVIFIRCFGVVVERENTTRELKKKIKRFRDTQGRHGTRIFKSVEVDWWCLKTPVVFFLDFVNFFLFGLASRRKTSRRREGVKDDHE